jgi:hypothetical protein
MGHGDIEAYAYQADLYCPRCMVRFFDHVAPRLPRYPELILELAAELLGINREDESSFDSGDFPKVVLGINLNDDRYDHCGSCGDCLDHDHGDCAEDQPKHADYPHEPGTLYDCEACETRCHCNHIKAQYDPSYTQCVFCALLQERHPQ